MCYYYIHGYLIVESIYLLLASHDIRIMYLQVPGNDDLFFDDQSYHEELASFCGHIIQDVILAIKQEASPVCFNFGYCCFS